MTADAYHTLTDSLSSAIVIFSGWLSRKPADEKHPFGHGRSDLISSVIIGVMLALIGFEFLLKSVEQIKSGVGVDYGLAAIIVTLLSILVKESMAQFAFWASRKSQNSILRADGWHHRADALSSVIILAGILCSSLAVWIDGALGVLVSLMIFYASYEILRDSVSRLIGETPDRDLIEKIDLIIDEMNLNVRPHHFHLHRYGNHIELTFHLTMEAGLTLDEAHEHAHRVERALRDQLGIEATIHMEPEGQT